MTYQRMNTGHDSRIWSPLSPVPCVHTSLLGDPSWAESPGPGVRWESASTGEQKIASNRAVSLSWAPVGKVRPSK